MTVKELITVLLSCPMDATVVLNMNRNEFANGREANNIEKAENVYCSDGWHGVYPSEGEELEEKYIVNLTS